MLNLGRHFRNLAAALILVTVAASATFARAPEPLRFDINDALNAITSGLSNGTRSAESTLFRLGPEVQQALQSAASGEDFKYLGFSAQTQIQMLFTLAKNAESNEGNRFLAKLHALVGETSADAAINPDLLAISGQFSPESLAPPLRLASITSLTPEAFDAPLPPSVEKAIGLLADYTAPHGLGSMTALLSRHLNLGENPQRLVETRIARSGRKAAVIAGVIAAHIPPPSVESKVPGILLEAAQHNAAIAVDPRMMEALLGASLEPLPEPLAKYSSVMDQLPSHAAEAKHLGPNARELMTGRTSERFIQATNDAFAKGGVETTVGSKPDSFKAHRDAHASFSAENMEPRADAGGGGGVEPSLKRPGTTPQGLPVPRSYRVATLSARAARGVAVGAPLDLPSAQVKTAFWIPSTQDPLFGRFVVTTENGESVAASRFLFADSFEAAVDTLWGKNGLEAEYREGEITIMMSLDPDSSIGAAERRQVEAEFLEKLGELEREFEATTTPDLQLTVEMLQLYADIGTKIQSLPRGIVIHPALYGRQLAWAAARVDFWFNDMKRAKAEAEQVSGLDGFPADGLELMPENATTWQFFELDSSVKIESHSGDASVLKVYSRTRSPEEDATYTSLNHFAVSLFSQSDTSPSASAQKMEEGIYLLPVEAKNVQPLLDWMFLKHPDFIRLNDYSESLSILRWLDKGNTQLAILDADGPEAPIPTPDRIYIDDVGPSIGSR